MIIICTGKKIKMKALTKIKKGSGNVELVKDLFKLAFWMSKYYCCSLSKIFRCIIPTSIRKEINPKYHILLTSNKTKSELLLILKKLLKKSPKQAKAIEFFLKTKKKIFLSKLLSLTHSCTSYF